MRKIIILVLLLGVLTIACTSNQLKTAEDLCMSSGGEWREFPNSCVDSCAVERSPEALSCAFALTTGCDCGPDQCWNGNSCEAN